MRVAQRLDGLPLALELAAARLRMFTAGQLADRLEDLLGTLDAGGPNTAEFPILSVGKHRHTTLRQTVDWSYRTLPPDAAALLRALSVFAGSLDLAAVEWIAGAAGVDRLATLVDKSLIVTEPGQTRAELTYRIHGPIKAFAVRMLIASGEDSVRLTGVPCCVPAPVQILVPACRTTPLRPGSMVKVSVEGAKPLDCE